MPNISVIERSTSVPELVSDASITDLYSHFKRCCPQNDQTFHINTIRIIGCPGGSPRMCSLTEYPTSRPKNYLKTCPSKGSLNNFLPKKSPRISFQIEPKNTGSPKEPCRIISPQGSRSSLNNFLPKDSAKTIVPNHSNIIRVPKESPKSSNESLRSDHPVPNRSNIIRVPKESPKSNKESLRSGHPVPNHSNIIRVPKESPKSSKDSLRSGHPVLNRSNIIRVPKESPKSSKDSLRSGHPVPNRSNIIRVPKESPKSSKDSLRSDHPVPNRRIRVPKESPKSSNESLRSCHPRERCKHCSNQNAITFKCGRAGSSEEVSSDEALETADKRECVEELYFNNDAKKSGGSSPRGPSNREKRSDFLKIKPVCSADALKNMKKVKKSRSSEFDPEDSGATSSLMDSTSGTCDASAKYYHNKLLATLQVLQNKEETISVQADSLVLAEKRIATLNERASELKRELDRKAKEYSLLRKSMESCKPVQKHDVCLVTDRPMEDQTDIVNTLENNLSVIEDLYRECFYETAKQENLIEMLRSSYWDVRLCDRQKAEQIGRLQTVINSQQCSLDSCQDIALEVDGLKMEISNFLNSSSSTNNDSGMWERSEESYAPVPGVQDDLHDVREQLLRLQDLLAIKISGLQEKLCKLECDLSSKWDTEAKCQADIELKEQELARIRQQLIRSDECSKDQSSTVETMSIQLGQTKALLCEKTAEVSQLRQKNEAQANKIKNLEEELDKADQIIKENCKMRSEVAYLTTQVQLWRAQLDESKRRVHALETDLAHTRAQAAHIDSCYREKASNVAELQAHLEQAHARSTALCGEARRAVCAVRGWMRRMRDTHREKDHILKEKESLIAALQRRIEERQNDSQCTSASENTTSCSKCLSSRDARSFCSKSGIRRGECHAPSVSEMPSCSSSSARRPIRLLRQKQHGNNNPWMLDEALQEPVRRDACTAASGAPFCRHHEVRHVRVRLERSRSPRDVSPTEDLLLRVEQLSQALADGNRRWTRPRDAR